jgi:hypothetical protein
VGPLENESRLTQVRQVQYYGATKHAEYYSMNDLSKIADMAEILGALVVIGGLLFAIMQMRNFRQQRRELAAIELFRFFGNAKFNSAYEQVIKLPVGLSTEEIEVRHPGLEHCAMLICTTMENIGVMTYQRIVPYAVVENLIGSSTVLLWQKLEHWVFDLREELGSPNAFEWFQWLAERLTELEDPNQQPAYIAHKTWKPKRITREI